MSSIAVYKPYKPILFNDELDTASWSKEITNFAKLMSTNGHEVYLISETDFVEDPMYKNIHAMDYKDAKYKKFDNLIVFNGVFDRDKRRETQLINEIQHEKAFLMATDLSLTLEHHDVALYDKALSQHDPRIERILFNNKNKFEYAHLEKLWLYGKTKLQHDKTTSNDRIIFFGNERNRLSQILEFVLRPNVDWFGKSKTFNFNNFMTRSQLEQALSRIHKYSIIVSEDLYYSFGFVTQRYWECLYFDLIPFIDSKYDKGELLIKHDDFRKVSSYVDMFNKHNQLINNKDEYQNILAKQREEITDKMLTGEMQFDILSKWIK